MLSQRVLLLLAALVTTSCASASTRPATVTAPALVLQTETAPAPLDELVAKSRLTVLLFFTADCPVQKAHDARVRELVARYEPKGVSFVAVASEMGADLAAERASAQKRGLAMPLLEDRGAALADALGVEYSTHVVVLERDRRVLYSGAVDSDRTHLTESAQAYLRDALDASLAGREIARPRVEALGCPIRKH